MASDVPSHGIGEPGLDQPDDDFEGVYGLLGFIHELTRKPETSWGTNASLLIAELRERLSVIQKATSDFADVPEPYYQATCGSWDCRAPECRPKDFR